MPLSMFGKEKYIGIDIGHSTICLAQVEKSGPHWRIASLCSVPTPKESIGDGVVTDPQAVASVLKKCMRDNKITATTANLAVAGSSVVVRTVKMPQMPEATLRKSIRFEAGRYVPSSVEESYIEFEILDNLEDGQMEVLIAASPRDMVESKIEAAKIAGLDVECIDVEAFSLYRSLIECDERSQTENETIAIIDIGGENTQVSVIDHQIFSLTRSIPIGGTALTKALENYFKLSPEDAEEGKRSLDLRPLIDTSGPMENPPLRVVQPIVDELVREVRRSLNYFQSQQTGATTPSNINRLMFAGGGSLLQGLPEYMCHKLGIEFETPNLFDNPRFVFDGVEPNIPPNAIAIAIGLAMRRPGKTAVAA